MSYVIYEQKGDYAILTISREKALNALNPEVLSDIEKALDAVNLNSVRCLIITGAGQKSFVAGADIAAMCNYNAEQAFAFSKQGNDLFRKIETFPIPVIAAVNGFALGGGCELSMSCDIRLCSDNARFGQPEAGLGITAGFGGTQRLARIVGIGIAKELLYTCRMVKADEAKAIGLVNAVYPQAELMAAAEKLAGRIAANAPIAVRHTKQAVNEGLQVNIDEAVGIEEKLFSTCFGIDQHEAMDSFVNKRDHAPFQNK